MTEEQLTATLAKRVMGWEVAPDRFLTGNRSWIPRWKFNPLERLEDAFRLLDYAKPTRYAISLAGGAFEVEVESDGKVARAVDNSKPRAITLALARSLGLEV